MFSSYPREPGVAGSKNDFVFYFVGPLEVGQDVLIPPHQKAQSVKVGSLLAAINEVPTGRDVIAAVYKNGVQVGTVTIPAGLDQGLTTLEEEVLFEPEDRATARVLQVGSGRRGATMTIYARVT